MTNPMSAMISCNDGFRPVSFYIEAIDEPAEEPNVYKLTAKGLELLAKLKEKGE